MECSSKLSQVNPCPNPRRRLGLREFCLRHGHDPSNWSKLKREVLQPLRDEQTLRTWSRQLGLRPGSEDWHTFSTAPP
jgi:hypothetical protein